MNVLKTIFIFFLMLHCIVVFSQRAMIKGVVNDDKGMPIPMATVALKNTTYVTETSEKGEYELKGIPEGNYTIVALSLDRALTQQEIIVDENIVIINFTLREASKVLDEIVVEATEEKTLGISRLNAIDNFGVYEGKKTEVIVLRDITANTATNNARQIYSKITGLNIWGSDGAGIQLGIGGRGLSPNRTSNFNTRQNGYDISADALGYPESYYTPPAEALEKIEIIRGAASLQYGTQFGGLLNFKLKKGPSTKKVELTSRQTIGSWGFYGTFNSLGGTVAKGKLNYYTCYNYKTGNGYRKNSEFDYHNAYASVNYQITPDLLVNVDVTKMYYLAHQPGGLTDRLFDQDPKQSLRNRNWFKVDWNLFAVNLTYKFSSATQINIRNFGLVASRQSLGNLERITVADFGEDRTLIGGKFQNFGHETRLVHRYNLFKKQHAFVAGFRIYRGTSYAKQGNGNNGTGPDFYFLHPEDLENSDYKFPNENYAGFIENIFHLSRKLSITPGLRFESIRTYSTGYYKQVVYDQAGNVVVSNTVPEEQSRKRSFLFGGIGASYKHSENTEMYANISQNYRAINFTDLRIANPNFVVDPNIQDEKGYTADLGIRGNIKDVLKYEATLFYLAYKGRIGQVLRTDTILYNDYRFRGNISDARNIGIESFGELVISKLLNPSYEWTWSLFVNAAIIDAKYVNSQDASIRNKKVEMVPPLMLRTGSTFRYKSFSSTLQFSHIAKHFSDASNAKRTATAVEGLIPSYNVVDLSLRYQWKILTLEASCNNLLNEKYFTRRAESYPGPGIIPSDGRGFYVTLQLKL